MASYGYEKCGWDKDKAAWHANFSTMSNNEREEEKSKGSAYSSLRGGGMN